MKITRFLLGAFLMMPGIAYSMATFEGLKEIRREIKHRQEYYDGGQSALAKSKDKEMIAQLLQEMERDLGAIKMLEERAQEIKPEAQKELQNELEKRREYYREAERDFQSVADAGMKKQIRNFMEEVQENIKKLEAEARELGLNAPSEEFKQTEPAPAPGPAPKPASAVPATIGSDRLKQIEKELATLRAERSAVAAQLASATGEVAARLGQELEQYDMNISEREWEAEKIRKAEAAQAAPAPAPQGVHPASTASSADLLREVEQKWRKEVGQLMAAVEQSRFSSLPDWLAKDDTAKRLLLKADMISVLKIFVYIWADDALEETPGVHEGTISQAALIQRIGELEKDVANKLKALDELFTVKVAPPAPMPTPAPAAKQPTPTPAPGVAKPPVVMPTKPAAPATPVPVPVPSVAKPPVVEQPMPAPRPAPVPAPAAKQPTPTPALALVPAPAKPEAKAVVDAAKKKVLSDLIKKTNIAIDKLGKDIKSIDINIRKTKPAQKAQLTKLKNNRKGKQAELAKQRTILANAKKGILPAPAKPVDAKKKALADTIKKSDAAIKKLTSDIKNLDTQLKKAKPAQRGKLQKDKAAKKAELDKQKKILANAKKGILPVPPKAPTKKVAAKKSKK